MNLGVSVKLALFLRDPMLNLFTQGRNAFLYVLDQYDVQLLGQERNTQTLGSALVGRMLLEKSSFVFECRFHCHIIDDVLLTAALDSVVAELKFVIATFEKGNCICSLIH